LEKKQSDMRITGLDVVDVRFPTSEGLHGSDAVHSDPDYSAAYITLKTDAEGLEGNGLCFTLGLISSLLSNSKVTSNE
jgi:L-fuconate dehydratase